jgi:hypothetical protein
MSLKTEPILIVSYPRSGSSMVAGALAAHGVWTGTCRAANQHNPKGYFEHLGIEKLVGEVVGNCTHPGIIPDPVPGWDLCVERILCEDGYTGGPWLHKFSVVYWRLWLEFKPHWVVVRRSLAAIRASGKASRRFRANDAALAACARAMTEVESQPGTIVVEADRLIAGDYRALAKILARVGLVLDDGKVREFIDPTLWHYHA